MTRTFLIGIQILGFLIFSIGQKEEVKIDQDPPTSMGTAEEAVVTVNFDKSDVQGFAKFQITVGEGLSIEVVESKGASFTFNNGKAKFIWMALPSNEEFSIQYRIVTTGAANGNKALDSRFSYIYENERKNLDLPTHYIALGGGETAFDQSGEGEEPSAGEEHDTGGEAMTTDAPVFATATRTLRPDGVNQWRVNVEIEKTGITGFAKVEETLPEGYTAIDFKSSGAVFNSQNEVIKYIWYDVPESGKITVSYKLLPVIALNGEEPEITGTFSFLEEEETKEVPISQGMALMVDEAPKDTSGAEIVDETIAEPVEETEEEIAETVEEMDPVVPAKSTDSSSETPPKENPEPKPEPEIETEPVTASVEKVEKSLTDANIVDVPQPETGVFYRVQIAAGKNNVQQIAFEKMYGFEEGFKLENHKGWFKYTTGYHQVYKSARDDRKRITGKYDKFQGPFVTAYNEGERISVQEALMVTAQKWYP